MKRLFAMSEPNNEIAAKTWNSEHLGSFYLFGGLLSFWMHHTAAGESYKVVGSIYKLIIAQVFEEA